MLRELWNWIAISICQWAIRWMTRWRDSHNGYLPLPLFNGLIRLRPSFSTELVVYKEEAGELHFWLTLRQVAGDDPFNGMWHYTGGVTLYREYEMKTIARVARKEGSYAKHGFDEIGISNNAVAVIAGFWLSYNKNLVS